MSLGNRFRQGEIAFPIFWRSGVAKLYTLFAGADLSAELNRDRCQSPMWILVANPDKAISLGCTFVVHRQIKRNPLSLEIAATP